MADDAAVNPTADDRPVCGMVRPISDMRHLRGESVVLVPEGHWLTVHGIVEEAAALVGYRLDLVSNSAQPGVIMTDIIQNLAKLDVVVCDVSCQNANVVLELGLRMAFQKAVVLIKDRETDFAFDVSGIRHITYPRLLSYPDIQKFKAELSEAIRASVQAAKDGRATYLEQFGYTEVNELGTRDVTTQALARDMQVMRDDVARMSGMMKRIVGRTRVMPYPAKPSNPNLSADEAIRAVLRGVGVTTTSYDTYLKLLRGQASGEVSQAPRPPFTIPSEPLDRNEISDEDGAPLDGPDE